METKITFQVVNGNTGFEERDIEFRKLDIAKQYAIRNGLHTYMNIMVDISKWLMM